jgi:hypothetical protein
VGWGNNGTFNAVSENAPLPVLPVMRSGGNIEVSTSGGTYASLPSASCRQVLVVNDTGTTILVRQGGSGVGLPIRDGQSVSLLGITNANQISVRRKDSAATAVTVQARWEN